MALVTDALLILLIFIVISKDYIEVTCKPYCRKIPSLILFKNTINQKMLCAKNDFSSEDLISIADPASSNTEVILLSLQTVCLIYPLRRVLVLAAPL